MINLQIHEKVSTNDEKKKVKFSPNTTQDNNNLNSSEYNNHLSESDSKIFVRDQQEPTPTANRNRRSLNVVAKESNLIEQLLSDNHNNIGGSN